MEIDLNIDLKELDSMITQMKDVNKAIIKLKEENTMLKKEVVRLQWILEHQD